MTCGSQPHLNFHLLGNPLCIMLPFLNQRLPAVCHQNGIVLMGDPLFSAFTEMVVCESPVDTQQFLFMFHFRSFVFLRLLGNTYNAAKLANICKAPIKFDLKIHKKKTKKKHFVQCLSCTVRKWVRCLITVIMIHTWGLVHVTSTSWAQDNIYNIIVKFKFISKPFIKVYVCIKLWI